jgi:aspartate/methionine/tyrosine aminotransferase
LCGFKTGYGFTSNQDVLTNLRNWQAIIEPQAVNALILQEMLLKTNLGLTIYEKNQVILRQAVNHICSLLDEAHISYIRPKAGVFLMINLSSDCTRERENEFKVWQHLLTSKKVNITPGSLFGYREQGWYRLCPFTSLDVIEEGIRRIAAFVHEELR